MQLVSILAMSWENLFMLYADKEDAAKHAYPQSLISAFVVPCLDSITPTVQAAI